MSEPTAPRTVPWVRVAAAVLAAACLVGAVLLDQRGLRAEQAAVTRCAEEAEAADDAARSRLAAAAQYAAPAPGELAPRLIADAAGVARGGVAEALAACSAVDVRPWHPGTAARRDAVLAYLAARRDSLDAIAADGGRWYDDDEALARLRERAFAGG